MSEPLTIRLFIKPYCGWCSQAMAWLDAQGVPYTILDVTANPVARQEMYDLTHQKSAPCIEVDGHVLADFGTNELEEWWKRKGFQTKASVH